METADAITNTQLLLERFIAGNYSPHSPNIRNFFCVRCLEGPFNISQFKAGRPHASHPSLQVRKHTFRTHVVNLDDIAAVIDTSRLQPFQTNGASAIALHARHDVLRVREPSADRRMCEQCQDTITSTDPAVTLCSIECLLRSNRAPDEAPTAPARKNDHHAKASTRVRRTSRKPTKLGSDTGKEGDEMPLQGTQPTAPPVADESVRHELERRLNAAGEPEEPVNAADEVRWETLERRWSIDRQATIAATSEANPNFNRHDLGRVRHVGTFVRFMLDILPDYAEDDPARDHTTHSLDFCLSRVTNFPMKTCEAWCGDFRSIVRLAVVDANCSFDESRCV